MITQPLTQPQGMLVVTLYEGAGFSYPGQFKQSFNTNPESSLSTEDSNSVAAKPQISSDGVAIVHSPISSKEHEYLPYALLDFDRLQVFVNAISGTPENPLWAKEKTPYDFDVSKKTELAVHFYLRNPNTPSGSSRTMDIFLGMTRIWPRFEKNRASGLAGESGAEWLDV